MHMLDNERLASFEEDRPKFTPADIRELFGWSTKTFFRRLPDLPHSRDGKFIRFSERQIRQIFATMGRDAQRAGERGDDVTYSLRSPSSNDDLAGGVLDLLLHPRGGAA